MTKNENLKNGYIFPVGEKNVEYAKYFTGVSYLANLGRDLENNTSIMNVTFEPGCRNDWHKHIGGEQILLVLAGEGWYQEKGKTARFLKAGDVIVVPERVEHWHGATSDSWFEHVAITGGVTEWIKKVSDDEYSELPEVQ